VRFGSVCSAWRQVRKSPESWEEVYRTCWGDVVVLDGCQNLVQSFQKRWELLCQLPADLWQWSSCASKVKITSSTERQLNLDEASKATERALASARHSTLALAVMLNLSPSLLREPEEDKPQKEGGMGQGGEEGRKEERDSLQMRWVRHVVCNCHETRLAHRCADSCAKIARAARHAQWLVQDERLRKGWLHVLALCESSPSSAAFNTQARTDFPPKLAGAKLDAGASESGLSPLGNAVMGTCRYTRAYLRACLHKDFNRHSYIRLQRGGWHACRL
jgi:hypothetical protein